MKIKNLKQAVFAREYGASELMLASMTGHYPPPHTEIDKYIIDKYTKQP